VTGDAIRVLVVDDHAGFRAGVAALFETEPGLVLVGEAAGGADAIGRALELQPDVVLMDLNMPDTDGIAATRAIVDTSPHVAVVVLTMADNDGAVFEALRAGARGYLLKGAQRAELVRAIRAAASGDAIFGPAVARRLMAFFAASPPPGGAAFPELTDREREVLALIARGLSNQAIVERLVVSPKTVRNHVSNIFSKLQVRDRAEAIVRAREAGLGVDGGAD
jgi:DNA-binding NarL/FixJ family response regulator